MALRPAGQHHLEPALAGEGLPAHLGKLPGQVAIRPDRHVLQQWVVRVERVQLGQVQVVAPGGLGAGQERRRGFSLIGLAQLHQHVGLVHEGVQVHRVLADVGPVGGVLADERAEEDQPLQFGRVAVQRQRLHVEPRPRQQLRRRPLVHRERVGEGQQVGRRHLGTVEAGGIGIRAVVLPGVGAGGEIERGRVPSRPRRHAAGAAHPAKATAASARRWHRHPGRVAGVVLTAGGRQDQAQADQTHRAKRQAKGHGLYF